MKLWDAVCTTDPKHTKRINQRGGFTAIDAQYQIQTATEQFGPYGIGWGVRDAKTKILNEFNLIIYQAVLWYTWEGNHGEFCIESSINFVNGDRIDGDCVKKVATDAMTKGLSRMGFNADVFLGKFDGKYGKTPANKSRVDPSKYDHTKDVWFGKFAGMAWSKMSDSYLDFIIENSTGNLADRAKRAQEERNKRTGDELFQ